MFHCENETVMMENRDTAVTEACEGSLQGIIFYKTFKTLFFIKHTRNL